MLERLKSKDDDDTTAIAAWQSLRAAAPKIWGASKPVRDALIGEAVKKALGMGETHTPSTPTAGGVNVTEGAPTLRSVLNLLSGLWRTLSTDVERTFEDTGETAKEQEDEELWRARRAAARALFAYIEGTVHGMKQTAYAVSQLLDETWFRPEEIAVLQEHVRVDSVPNLRCAFEAFGRPLRSAYVLPTHGDGWESYRRAIEVRDRLTRFNTAFEAALGAGYERLGED